VLEAALWLCVAFGLIFVINLVPAFMPSSWMVMAFFYIQFDLPLLILTLGGAIVSGLGRLVLAKGSAWVKRRFMRPGEQNDLDELGAFLDERRHYLAPTTFLYALTPLPTNSLFVAAGLAEVSLLWVLAGFWSARMIADTLFVWTSDRVFDDIGDVVGGPYGGWPGVFLQIVGVISIVVLYRLPWARWLRRTLRPRPVVG
jgi:hypothetical protein